MTYRSSEQLMANMHLPLDILTEEEAGRIGSFVTIEVRRQGDAAIDVGYMMAAWLSAIHDKRVGNPMDLDMIIGWAKMLDPAANAATERFRVNPIWIGQESRQWRNLERQMELWMETVNSSTELFVPGVFNGGHDDATPNEWAYYEFENIHPFNDGNGRTGKIIFNWLNDTLLAPTWPHNFWGITNP